MNEQIEQQQPSDNNSLPNPQDDNSSIHTQVQALTTLDKVMTEYLRLDAPSLNRRHIFNVLAATALSFGSILLYIKPALAYAGDDLIREVGFEFSADAANFGVTFYAASEVFDYYFNSQLPKHIQQIIDADKDPVQCCTRFKKTVINILVIMIALASGAPFALAAEEAWFIKLIIEATNAVLNTFGLVKLGPEVYQKLIAPLTRKSVEQYNHELLIHHLLNTLDILRKDIIKNRGVPADLSYNDTGEGVLTALYNHAKNDLDLISNTKRIPCNLRALQKTSPVAGTAGAILLPVGFTGYWIQEYVALLDLSKYNFLRFLANPYYTIPIAAFFGASYGFLGMTVGAYALVDILHFLLVDLPQVASGKSESVALQFRPKTTIALYAITTAIAVFSYATSVHFIDKSALFQKDGALEDFKDPLEYIAGFSSILFNAYANKRLSTNIVEAYLRYFGDPTEKKMALFDARMKDMPSLIKQLSPMQLIESIKKTPDEIKSVFFNLPENHPDDLEGVIRKAQYGDITTEDLKAQSSEMRDWGYTRSRINDVKKAQQAKKEMPKPPQKGSWWKFWQTKAKSAERESLLLPRSDFAESDSSSEENQQKKGLLSSCTVM